MWSRSIRVATTSTSSSSSFLTSVSNNLTRSHLPSCVSQPIRPTSACNNSTTTTPSSRSGGFESRYFAPQLSHHAPSSLRSSNSSLHHLNPSSFVNVAPLVQPLQPNRVHLADLLASE